VNSPILSNNGADVALSAIHNNVDVQQWGLRYPMHVYQANTARSRGHVCTNML
jgi:hypothetical protein